jgi:hypothetical protein
MEFLSQGNGGKALCPLKMRLKYFHKGVAKLFKIVKLDDIHAGKPLSKRRLIESLGDPERKIVWRLRRKEMMLPQIPVRVIIDGRLGNSLDAGQQLGEISRFPPEQ